MRKHDTDSITDHYLDGMKRLVAISNRNRLTYHPREDGRNEHSKGPSMNMCLVCGYMWDVDHGKKEGPRKCPACSSILWNSGDLKRHKCKQCSHIWMSKLDEPLVCPSCKSKLWNKEVERLECISCGHMWTCRTDRGLPKKCPSCHSCEFKPELVECMCKKCGYSGKMKSDRVSGCPICKNALSPYGGMPERRRGAGRSKDSTRKRSTEVDSRALDVLRSDISDTRKIIELESKAGLRVLDAEILVRFMNGEDRVSIARAMDAPLNRVMVATMLLCDMMEGGSLQ